MPAHRGWCEVVSRGSSGHDPWFVARKDMATNTLYVMQGHDHPWLLSPALHGDALSCVAGAHGAKTRYRQPDAACRFEPESAGDFVPRFDLPQWAVTHGQSAVLHDGEVCLGGGVIAAAIGAGLSADARAGSARS